MFSSLGKKMAEIIYFFPNWRKKRLSFQVAKGDSLTSCGQNTFFYWFLISKFYMILKDIPFCEFLHYFENLHNLKLK